MHDGWIGLLYFSPYFGQDILPSPINLRFGYVACFGQLARSKYSYKQELEMYFVLRLPSCVPTFLPVKNILCVAV